ncbi:MAG TPA: RDD family protein [Acidimicrobiales bacterium]|nr:RDD family protein [Acidimicrobiales bacterium]
MNCSNCGTEMIGTNCPACDRNLPDGARGPIDPTTGLMLAGFGRRLGQMFADELILIIPVSVFIAVFDQVGGNFLGALAGFVLVGLYLFKLTSGAKGQTLGNRVAATRIRDAATGKMLTTKQALQRTVIVMFYFVTAFALPRALLVVVVAVAIIDNLYPLFDARNQTLHDKIVGTIVVVA